MVYTRLIFIAIIVVALIAVALLGFWAYRQQHEHAGIRVAGFILMALCGFLAIFIPAATLTFGYDEVCIAWTEGDAYFFQRDYLRSPEYYQPPNS